MKQIIILSLTLFYFGNCASTTTNGIDPKENDSWSNYQGETSWNEAKAKCASINMRLPTRDELKAAYDAKVTEPWEKDGTYYWTSEEFSETNAYYFSVDFGDVFPNKTKVKHIRCIK